MSTSAKDLEQLRERIDALDEKILNLFNERAGIAIDVAEAKRTQGETGSFYRPEREADVLHHVVEKNNGPLNDNDVAHMFRALMSACLSAEAPLTVGFLGPEGTYSHAAALKHFGYAINIKPLSTIDDVFREVEAETANFGVVPIENSTEGVISNTLDNFIDSILKVCGEVSLRIHHHLLTKSASLQTITHVYSHQQSLAQCRRWLAANLPHVEQVNVSSNAEAARRAAEDSTAAAIAGEQAGELYELASLVSNIEDDPNNTTRFLVIGKIDTSATGEDKTSIMVSSQNEAGALYKLLAPLARHRVSMSKIESRPSHSGLWEYVFFLDLDGHISEPAIAEVLEEIGQQAVMLKLLGSYPKSVLDL
ncbi:P-protein [bacterium BMS3Bbin11]|nr:P-protein [bacterium BMS3Abin11]GBE45164.1 P-protein [bacterium BMS3Bbin11]GMT40026.1 MAG: P-protein [bacterium]HDH08528.1 prephenate dehydratase [Gammaproteobacteria bacterium]HDH16783.1 prephenate dehydratase [Gammaproteobacteria bacterium]